jgi:hypothetical protein
MAKHFPLSICQKHLNKIQSQSARRHSRFNYGGFEGRAFLAAQVEIDQFCDKFKSLHLIMEDLKAAREEILGIVQAADYPPLTKWKERFEVESKTTVSSVFGTVILRLLYTTGDADEVLEMKIGPTLLGRLQALGLGNGGAALLERKRRLGALPPFERAVATEHVLAHVVRFLVARVVAGKIPKKPRQDRFLFVSFGATREIGGRNVVLIRTTRCGWTTRISLVQRACTCAIAM